MYQSTTPLPSTMLCDTAQEKEGPKEKKAAKEPASMKAKAAPKRPALGATVNDRKQKKALKTSTKGSARGQNGVISPSDSEDSEDGGEEQSEGGEEGEGNAFGQGNRGEVTGVIPAGGGTSRFGRKRKVAGPGVHG